MMRGHTWLALLVVVVLALADAAAGRFVVEKNSIQVTSPDELKGKYECAIGNFGVPQYGGTLHGLVEYPKSNRKACQSFDISFKPKQAGGRPTFVLVDRGGDLESLCIRHWPLFCWVCFFHSVARAGYFWKPFFFGTRNLFFGCPPVLWKLLARIRGCLVSND
jgi:hypothetical protein